MPRKKKTPPAPKPEPMLLPSVPVSTRKEPQVLSEKDIHFSDDEGRLLSLSDLQKLSDSFAAAYEKVECSTCPYWHRQDASPLGLCKRQLLSVVDPRDLTPFGPRGKFAVMPSSEVCGEHPRYLAPV